MSPPTRAAIYARMSTDKQSADSPADQIARCREFATARGWQVVEDLVVTDAGVSGASRHNRPRLLALVARVTEFDVLLCWEFSRLARDSEDLGWIRNRLRAAKKTALEASTGLDAFNVGSKVMGIIAEEYLVKLRADTHRGMRGRAERGLATGNVPYGFRTAPLGSGRFDAHGAEIPAGFRIVVHEAEAAIVRRIFELAASGDGLRRIARRLNDEGIPSPRGRGWAPSALLALLNNRMYLGERVWNRSEWIKDHETGRRRRYERPESEWLCQHSPELTIVDERAFSAASRERAARRAEIERGAGGRIVASLGRNGRRPYLLSGLLECGACGGGFYRNRGTATLGCAFAFDRGPTVCTSRLRVAQSEIESRIVAAIDAQILTPRALRYVIERALGIVRARLASEPPEQLRARLAEIELEMSNLARFAAKTGRVDEATTLYAELDRERHEIESRLGEQNSGFDLEALFAVASERASDLRGLLERGGDDGRRALRSLLAPRRMRVSSDPVRGFRVEGLIELRIETENPGRERTRSTAGVLCGSGGGI